jgi:hypothetical protein
LVFHSSDWMCCYVCSNELFSGSPGDRSNVANLLIVITDGQTNEEVAQLIPEALATQGVAR